MSKQKTGILGKIIAFIVATALLAVAVISTACLFNSDFRSKVENKLGIEQTIDSPTADSDTVKVNSDALVTEYEELLELKEAELLEQKTSYELQLSEKEIEIQTFETTLAEKDEQIKTLESEVIELETQIAELETQLAELKTQNADNLNEIEQLEHDIVLKNQEISSLENEVSALTAERDEFEQKYETTLAEKQQLERDLEYVNTDIEALKAQDTLIFTLISTNESEKIEYVENGDFVYNDSSKTYYFDVSLLKMIELNGNYSDFEVLSDDNVMFKNNSSPYDISLYDFETQSTRILTSFNTFFNYTKVATDRYFIVCGAGDYYYDWDIANNECCFFGDSDVLNFDCTNIIELNSKTFVVSSQTAGKSVFCRLGNSIYDYYDPIILDTGSVISAKILTGTNVLLSGLYNNIFNYSTNSLETLTGGTAMFNYIVPTSEGNAICYRENIGGYLFNFSDKTFSKLSIDSGYTSLFKLTSDVILMYQETTNILYRYSIANDGLYALNRYIKMSGNLNSYAISSDEYLVTCDGNGTIAYLNLATEEATYIAGDTPGCDTFVKDSTGITISCKSRSLFEKYYFDLTTHEFSEI